MSAHEVPTTQLPDVHDCVICLGKWPEHLTVRHGEQFICCPCHGKLKDEAFCKLHAATLSRYSIGNTQGGKGKLMGWLVLALVLLVGGAYGIYMIVQASKKTAAPPPPVIVQKIDVGTVLIGTNMSLKSGANLAPTMYLVRGPSKVVGVVPGVSFANTTTGGNPVQAGISIFSQFNQITLVPIFPTTVPVDKDKKQGPIIAAGIEGNPDVTSQKLIWLLNFNPADISTPPVKVLEMQPMGSVIGASLALLRVNIVDGKPVQDLVQARVDSAFMNGARLTVALTDRLPAKGLIGAAIVNPDGQFVGTVDGFGEPPDAQGTVKFVDVMSSFDMFGLTPPPPPKPEDVAKEKEAAANKPAKKKSGNPLLDKIMPNGNPYDRPEYKELQ